MELLFKRWKSGSGLGKSRGRLGPRVLCEFLAKLLGVLIKHWGTLLRGGPLCVVSPTRAAARVKWWAGRLAEAIEFGRAGAVERVLKRLKADLDRLPKRPKRKRKPRDKPCSHRVLHYPDSYGGVSPPDGENATRPSPALESPSRPRPRRGGVAAGRDRRSIR